MRKKMLLNTPASPPSRLLATPTSLLGLSSFTKPWSCSWLTPTDWSGLNGLLQEGLELWAVILQQGRELDACDDQNRR